MKPWLDAERRRQPLSCSTYNAQDNHLVRSLVLFLAYEPALHPADCQRPVLISQGRRVDSSTPLVHFKCVLMRRDVAAPLASRPGEFHPKPLSEPCVNLSIHTAPAIPLKASSPFPNAQIDLVSSWRSSKANPVSASCCHAVDDI